MRPKANRDTTTDALIQVLCGILVFIMLAYVGMHKMDEEFWMLLQWWITAAILGIAFYPLTALIFRRFDDRGYLFSKAIGIMAAGWLMWALSSLHILSFSTVNCYVCLAVCVVCNYGGVLLCRVVLPARKKKKELAAEQAADEEEQTASDDVILTASDEKKRTASGNEETGTGRVPQREDMPKEHAVPEKKAVSQGNKYLSVVEQVLEAENAPAKTEPVKRLVKRSVNQPVSRPVEDEETYIETADCEKESDKKRGIPWGRIVFLEILFFMMFLAYMYVKGFNPKAFGTEKMMDYGFMTSMFKTDYFPTEDFWFAGDHLNYYYFGQYLMTFLTKMSFNSVARGYNLALGMGFAFCMTLSYALVCQVMKVLAAHKKKRHPGAVAHAAGAVAAVAVTLASNGHYLIFGRLVPMLWDILQIPGTRKNYWFPSSTRYIGYVPDTHDKTIHEFPSYSFVLGDLHAHVINITFVLTILAILFAFLMNRQEKMTQAVMARKTGGKAEISFYREVFQLPVFAIGFVIGIFMMTNYWDFPIYFVVSGAVILASNAVICGFDKRTWLMTALHALIVLAVSFAAALLFNMHFVPMANGILLTKNHTLFYQLVILWGLPFVVVTGYLTALIAKEVRRSREGRFGGRFTTFLENLQISDLFVLIMGLCAMGLVLTPEVIYMSDIYAGDYKRSNTMFKLTYQAYILFGLSMAYILTRFILLKETRRQRRYALIGLVMVLWTAGYSSTSVKAWFGDIGNEDRYQGMRADQYIYEEQPEDAAAISWLNDYVQGRPVILEANGDSYTIYNRVSVLTGMPTVLGWHTHEWLWHNTVIPVDKRAEDIRIIYTSQDEEVVRSLLNEYAVEYLFIGTCEYEKYMGQGMNPEFLKGLGEVVYEGAPGFGGRTVTIVKVK